MLSMVSQWVGSWGWNARAITVSRMQDKIVETPDGAFHMVLNYGPFRGLELHTSTDNGVTWHKSFEFEQTGRYSTAHLELLPDGETLTVSYQGAWRDVVYQTLAYDMTSAEWDALTSPVTILEAGQTAAIGLPNHVIGAEGVLFAVSMGNAFFVPKVNIAASTDNGETWASIDLRLFGSDLAAVRLVASPDVTGAIIATEHSIYWYDPANTSAPIVQISDNGSFAVLASHFSVTVAGNNIYLANVTTEVMPQVEVFVYDGDTGAWHELEIENTFASEAYVQISSTPDGRLYLTLDDFGTSTVRVLESLDGGLTWTIAAQSEVEESVFPGLTRITAPEYFTDDLVILQMIQPWEGSPFYGVSAMTLDVNGDGGIPFDQAMVPEDAPDGPEELAFLDDFLSGPTYDEGLM